MSSPATIPTNNSAPVKEKPSLVPPEERFWKRYSPHHEFSFSGVASTALHALVVAGVIAVGYLAIRSDRERPLPLETLDPTELSGGGGNPQGQGDRPGDLPPAKGAEAVAKPNTDPSVTAVPKPDTLANPTADPLEFPEIKDPDARFIDADNQAVAALAQVSKDARTELMKAVPASPGPGKGQGGPGQGGGKGRGKGKGVGDAEGDGTGNLNVRQRRALRWVISFGKIPSDVYLERLGELGCILAVPLPPGGYQVFRNLKQKPPQGAPEDVSQVKKIFWVDRDRDSVEGLAQLLGFRHPPPFIAGFMPEELEDELLKKELAYRGKKESELKETRFVVRPGRGGGYDVTVVSQH